MVSNTKNESPEARARRLAQGAEYRARKKEQDPDYRAKRCEASKTFRERNPERVKQICKTSRKKHRNTANEGRRRWRALNIVAALFAEARSRSKKQGRSFTVNINDIPPMGTHCPLLGTPFPPPSVRDGSTSPSLDRINPKLGYEPGNVWIVSRRANTIKNDATIEELESIVQGLRRRFSEED